MCLMKFAACCSARPYRGIFVGILVSNRIIDLGCSLTPSDHNALMSLLKITNRAFRVPLLDTTARFVSDNTSD